MKKLLLIVALAIPCVSMAAPLIHGGGGGTGPYLVGSTSAGPLVVAVVGTAFLVAHYWNAPTPYNLSDECKPQMVTAPNSNISSVSYEHCLKK